MTTTTNVSIEVAADRLRRSWCRPRLGAKLQTLQAQLARLKTELAPVAEKRSAALLVAHQIELGAVNVARHDTAEIEARQTELTDQIVATRDAIRAEREARSAGFVSELKPQAAAFHALVHQLNELMAEAAGAALDVDNYARMNCMPTPRFIANAGVVLEQTRQIRLLLDPERL